MVMEYNEKKGFDEMLIECGCIWIWLFFMLNTKSSIRKLLLKMDKKTRSFKSFITTSKANGYFTKRKKILFIEQLEKCVMNAYQEKNSILS